MKYNVILLRSGKVEVGKVEQFSTGMAVLSSNIRTLYRPSKLNSGSTAYIPSPNPRVYTYEDKSSLILNASTGDYIPPNYIHVSNRLDLSARSVYSRRRMTSWDPIDGFILNPNMYFLDGHNRFGIRPPLTDQTYNPLYDPYSIIGWNICARRTSDTTMRGNPSISHSPEGVYNDTDLSMVLSQVIDKRLLVDIHTISLRIPSCAAVMFNDIVTLPDTSGLFTYEVPINTDIALSIPLPPRGSLGPIEIIG